MISEHLITLVETMSEHVGRSEATLSNKAAGNATLFERLRTGKGCTIRTAQRAVLWFSDNWPADLAWPKDIPRPSKVRNAA